MPDRHRDVLRDEFTRAADSFDERTAGRFDELGVVDFARFGGGSVAEVGAGTGAFLALFDGIADLQIGVDVTRACCAGCRASAPTSILCWRMERGSHSEHDR